VSSVLAAKLPLTTPLIYPCTNSGYGIGGEAECTEESPLNPLSHYGRTKVAAEAEIMRRKNSVSLRLATLFGWSPRMRRDLLVNDMVWRATRDRSAVIFEGGFRRNFCHVRDAAGAFIHVLNNWDQMKGQIYNVGLSDANVSKRELCEHIQKQVPDFVFVDAPVGKDPDQRNYIVSNAKIESTGFKPIYSLDAGISDLIKGYTMIKNTRYGNV
jgi:nucleoside-diphosphate-sugar epimerase